MRRLEARPGPAAAHGHRSQARPYPPASSTPVGLVTLMGGSARRLVVRPSPTAAHGRRSQAVPTRRPGSETAIAFAGAGRASTETPVAFACEKWVFLVQFSGAVAMSVSAARRRGCAVVLLVSMSPWFRAWCAKKFARRRCVIAKVRKSSPGGSVSSRKREKVRPAGSNWPEIGVLWCAGRVFSRKSHWRGCAGRVFSRQPVLCPGLV